MQIVVEGCGQWAMKYFEAITSVLVKTDRQDVGVFFTYDSDFGRDGNQEVYRIALDATMKVVHTIEKGGFPCLDVHQRDLLPTYVDAVFIVTPDSTHCDRADYWLGRARWVFVEKPFDASTARIRNFLERMSKQTYTDVYAVDHYLVRCNPVAISYSKILKYLLAGKITNDITRFEFCMTERPQLDSARKYTDHAVRIRQHTLKGGMVFDMGSHALPVLLPFIDMSRPVDVDKVWSGVSEGLRSLIPEAETASIADVDCYTRTTTNPARGGNQVRGKFIVGKDIEDPAKHLIVHGPGGKVTFDLSSFQVAFDPPAANISLALEPKWTEFFIESVIKGDIPKSVAMFRPRGALKVIEFLEVWRDRCQGRPEHHREQPGHARQGTTAQMLQEPPFEC